jgi:small-conductance mechanosensitive channel
VNAIYFGNTIKAWLISAGIAAVVYLALVLIKRLVVSRLGKLAARTENDFDDAIVEVIRNTRTFFLLAVAFYAGIRGISVHPRLIGPLEKFLELLILLQVGLWASGLVGFLVTKSLEKRDQASDRIGVAALRAIGVGAKVVAWIIVSLVALQSIFNRSFTTLVTGFGIGGIAIALAVQNILGDLLAAVAIVFDRPFDVGDTIQVDQLSGKVEQIGLKTTRLRSTTGEQLILGNGELLKSRLRNYKRMYERRALLQVDIEYATDPSVVERIPTMLKHIVEAQGGGVRFERSHFSAFTENALRVETVYFVLDPDYNRYMDVQQSINLAVLKKFKAEKIEFAFPTRTVELKTSGGGSGAESAPTAVRIPPT